jgi:hypothetical protein
LKLIVTSELSHQEKEGTYAVDIAFSQNIVVLHVRPPVEGDLLFLHLAVLDLDLALVSAQDDGNIPADASQVPMPVPNILVSNARCDIKHYDITLSLNVVAIMEAATLFELCLAS